MKHINKYYLEILILFLLPGCNNRYYCWFNDVFNQGTDLDKFNTIPLEFIRSTRIYDQFTTLGIFDALWLADPVKQAYVQSYGIKHCLDQQQQNAMLANQLQDNDQYISFYVLAYYPGQDNCSLNSDDSLWVVRLIVDGNCYAPLYVRAVELPFEYQIFFGKKYNIFKRSYLVVFNQPTGSPANKSLSLVFRSVGRQAELTWCFDQSGNLMRPCGLENNILAYDVDCGYNSCR